MSTTEAAVALSPAGMAGQLIRDISVELNRINGTQPSVHVPPETLASRLEGDAWTSRALTPEFSDAVKTLLNECRGILYGVEPDAALLANLQDMGPKVLLMLQSTPVR